MSVVLYVQIISQLWVWLKCYIMLSTVKIDRVRNRVHDRGIKTGSKFFRLCFCHPNKLLTDKTFPRPIWPKATAVYVNTIGECTLVKFVSSLRPSASVFPLVCGKSWWWLAGFIRKIDYSYSLRCRSCWTSSSSYTMFSWYGQLRRFAYSYFRDSSEFNKPVEVLQSILRIWFHFSSYVIQSLGRAVWRTGQVSFFRKFSVLFSDDTILTWETGIIKVCLVVKSGDVSTN